MFQWIVTAYVAAVLLIIVSAAYVALAMRTAARRHDGYKVLRLLLSGGAIAGLIGILIKLHEIGAL